MPIQRFLRQQCMSFAAAQVSRRRPNRFRDLMAVLKLGAIDFNDGTGIFQQSLGGCFDNTRFSAAARPQKKKIRNWASSRTESGQVRLASPHNLVNGFVLSNEKVAEAALRILGLRSRLTGIQ
jgi:hypothetical protein